MSRERPTKVEDNDFYFTFSLSNFIVVRSTDNTKQHNTILYYTILYYGVMRCNRIHITINLKTNKNKWETNKHHLRV